MKILVGVVRLLPGPPPLRNGSSWAEYPLKGWTGQGQIRAITSSGGETWIGGGTLGSSGSSSYLAHYDGSTWTSVTPPPIPADTSDRFVKVAPVGPNDLWAITRKYLWVASTRYGTPTSYRYSGGTWHPATLPAGPAMYDITAIPGTSTIWGVAHKAGLSDPAVLNNA